MNFSISKKIHGGLEMKNDFKRKDFYVVKNEKQQEYYILIKKDWIQITKDVYAIYQRSYQKMYRDQKRDHKRIVHYQHIDDMYSYVINKHKETNLIEEVAKEEIKRLIQTIIRNLPKEEQYIISSLYYEEMTEKQVANYLGMSQQSLHYRKKKILKKMKLILLNEI